MNSETRLAVITFKSQVKTNLIKVNIKSETYLNTKDKEQIKTNWQLCINSVNKIKQILNDD